MNDLRSLYCGKRVLITGAAGTIGKALIDALLPLEPEEIRAIDNNESTPLNALDFTGTPSTGREVFAAAMPGR